MSDFNRTRFNAWMAQVDSMVTRICGLGVHDLPDQCFADWFQDGISPREAAERALEDSGFPMDLI